MLDPRASAITLSVLFAASCLFVGLANLVWPGYGDAFLNVMDSIYFGLVARGSVASVLALTVLSAIDGAIMGFIAAWLYNRLASSGATAS